MVKTRSNHGKSTPVSREVALGKTPGASPESLRHRFKQHVGEVYSAELTHAAVRITQKLTVRNGKLM